MPLISLLPLFGISLLLQRRFGLRAALALMLAVAGWFTVVYVGGLAGVLKPVAIGVWVLGALLFVALLPWWFKQARRDGLDLVYALFVVFCVAFWFVHHDSQFFYYDEYGHWGIYLRDMWALDSFWQADSNARHLRYPPAGPLWQYAFTVFAPRVDASAYMAQFVLLIAPAMVLFDGLGWKRPGWVIALTLGAVAGLASFGHGVASLYVDHLVSTWFAGVLLAFILERKPSLGLVAALALPLVVLSLLKDAGLAFTLAAAGIIGAVWLADRWKDHGGGRAVITAVACGLLLIAPSFVALGSWSANRDAAGVVRETQSLTGVLGGVMRGERALDDEATALIRERYRNVFMHQQLAKDDISAQFNAFSVPMMSLFEDRFRVSTASFYLLFALFFLLVLGFGRPRGQTLRWSLLATGALGTALAYSAVLYLSYQFAFGERGLLVTSYIRYTHSAALALLLIALASLSPAHGLHSGTARLGRVSMSTGGAAITAVLAWLFILETPYLRNFTDQNPRLEPRIAAEPLMREIRSSVGERRLWVYFPVDRPNGFLGRLIQFQLAPTPTTIERSAEFIAQPDETLTAALADYDVLWFPVSNADTDARVAAALGVELRGRFVETLDDGSGGSAFRLYEFGRDPSNPAEEGGD
ncbi:MAG: hypothetical protein AAFY69_06185 [Pseudomonadota bacterium]